MAQVFWLLKQEAQQRRGADGAGRPQSTFRPVVGQRGQVPHVPRPGPLCRNQRGQSSRAPAAPYPQASCVSSMKQDAISSCYSCTVGLPGLGRRAPAPSHTRPSPGSAKDPRVDSLQKPCSAPQVSQKTGDKVVADTASSQEETRKECHLTTEGSGLGRRKIPLFWRERGDPRC